MLLKRIVRRSKRAARELADIPLRRRLSTSPRLVRTLDQSADPFRRSTLVVTAHPDDESIAAAALMKQVPRLGVICVTNGAPLKESYSRQAGFDNWLDYAFTRRAELAAAVSLLDHQDSHVECLGITDQDASYNLVVVTRYLAKRLQGFEQVLTHAYEGGHPDHDAAAFCVHAACALMRREGHAAPSILEAPLYNAPDQKYVHQVFLPHPDAGPLIVLQLSPEQQALKRRMFASHKTQERAFLDFQAEKEQYRLAPRYHFCAPPHPSDAGYNQFNWPLNGRVWRRLAWKAMRELDLLELA